MLQIYILKIKVSMMQLVIFLMQSFLNKKILKWNDTIWILVFKYLTKIDECILKGFKKNNYFIYYYSSKS